METYGDEPIVPNPEFGNVGAQGLTKREYFSAMAIQGALSSSVGGAFREIDHKYFAEHAVKFADALIQALNSKRGE